MMTSWRWSENYDFLALLHPVLSNADLSISLFQVKVTGSDVNRLFALFRMMESINY